MYEATTYFPLPLMVMWWLWVQYSFFFSSTQALCKFWSRQLFLMDPPVFLICLPPQLLSFCMICSVVCRSARNNLRSLSFSLSITLRVLIWGLSLRGWQLKFTLCSLSAIEWQSGRPLLSHSSKELRALWFLSHLCPSHQLMLPNKSTRGFISLIMLTGLPP